MHRKYIIYFVLFIFLLGLPLGYNYLFLQKIGELDSQKRIAENLLQDKTCLYGSGVFDNYSFKYEAYKIRQPEILVLGSSRVLQFKGEYFSRPFYNMGQTISSMPMAENVVEFVLAGHKPKIVIIGVDFWWFNHSIKQNSLAAKGQVENKFEAANLTLPFKWLRGGKISLHDYTHLPFAANSCKAGIKVIKENAGTGHNGDYFYTALATDKSAEVEDFHFNDTKDRIKSGNRKFEYGEVAGEAEINSFKSLIAKLEARGIKVILFFPPVAPSIMPLLENGNYKYAADLKGKLRAAGIKFHDYTDPASIGASDCEFVDGYHGGDVVYARILKSLSAEGIGGYLDMGYINTVIAKYPGRAMIPNPYLTTKPEYDFLGLGCTKAQTGL